jgi:tryptophan 2,3-dioxygenase
VVEIQKLLVQQIHILETMTPIEFLEFRDRLMPASGFQSMQFREFEFACGLKDERYLKFFDNRPDLRADLERRLEARDLKTAYYDLLRRQGYKIPASADESKPEHSEAILKGLADLYQNPEKSLPLYLLSESLLEIDEYLALWREHHVRVVERVIGFKQGTGGSSGVQYLRSTTTKKAFPLLWEVRGCLEKRG